MKMRSIFVTSAFSLLFVVGCGRITDFFENSKEYKVDTTYKIDDTHPSRHQNERISSLIFHYTALNFEDSLKELTEGKRQVSSHWLVPEDGDTIYKLVDENKRAYHAGISVWKGRSNINDTSVGVETVNLGFVCPDGTDKCPKNERIWYPYPEAQQQLLVALGKDIVKRYKIDPLCVVAHSDLAPSRKSDPGPLFPWKLLAENGVGAWVTDEEIQTEIQNIKLNITSNISKIVLQTRLFEYGYNIKKSTVSDDFVKQELIKLGYNANSKLFKDLKLFQELNEKGKADPSLGNNIFDDKLTEQAIDAFLMHYLPDDYLSNKIPDYEKILATTQALFVKYPNRVKSSCGF